MSERLTDKKVETTVGVDRIEVVYHPGKVDVLNLVYGPVNTVFNEETRRLIVTRFSSEGEPQMEFYDNVQSLIIDNDLVLSGDVCNGFLYY